jgi:hypothetical protein
LLFIRIYSRGFAGNPKKSALIREIRGHHCSAPKHEEALHLPILSGDFANVVATGLWPVCFLRAFHIRETAHRAVATADTLFIYSL